MKRKILFKKKNIEGAAGRTKNIEGGSGISTVDDIDKVELETPSTRNTIGDGPLDVNRDREYQEAVERGDLKVATDMLMEKLWERWGIFVPFFVFAIRMVSCFRVINMPGIARKKSGLKS